MNEIKMQRRQFLSMIAVGATVAPLAGLVAAPAVAADLPMVSADDPTAKAIGYVADAATLKNEPMYKAGSACASCMLFQGTKGAASGPCGIFPGKAVSAKGWCKSYSAKP